MFIIILPLLLLISSPTYSENNFFVKVKDLHFEVDGTPYKVKGTNYWQGMNLASSGLYGDRPRLIKELDFLKDHGIRDLRIMAATEGDGTVSGRIYPALMTYPGSYNYDLFAGLDFLLHEMDKRDMRAILVLNNFWDWSGGMTQYVEWALKKLNLPNTPSPNYLYVAERFYRDDKIKEICKKWYYDHIKKVITRKNLVTGQYYYRDPTILAYEIANEPRYYPKDFIHETAKYIKSLAPKQLVTTGSEGRIGGPFIETHESPYVDFATIHIWVQNWEVFNPKDPSPENLQRAIDFAENYVNSHKESAIKYLKKPLLLEEYGMGRDGFNDQDMFDPKTPITNRNKYFKSITNLVYKQQEETSPVVGQMFWAFGGLGKPTNNNGVPPFIGDPPHEPQGWYSVYMDDKSTFDLFNN